MGVRTVLPLLVLCCCVAVIAAQELFICGDGTCPSPSDILEGRLDRIQCCRYFGGCCDNAENGTRDLLRNLAIGLSVAVFAMIVIFVALVVACCWCGCLSCLDCCRG